jgi:hypothetical protein
VPAALALEAFLQVWLTFLEPLFLEALTLEAFGWLALLEEPPTLDAPAALEAFLKVCLAFLEAWLACLEAFV